MGSCSHRESRTVLQTALTLRRPFCRPGCYICLLPRIEPQGIGETLLKATPYKQRVPLCTRWGPPQAPAKVNSFNNRYQAPSGPQCCGHRSTLNRRKPCSPSLREEGQQVDRTHFVDFLSFSECLVNWLTLMPGSLPESLWSVTLEVVLGERGSGAWLQARLCSTPPDYSRGGIPSPDPGLRSSD